MKLIVGRRALATCLAPMLSLRLSGSPFPAAAFPNALPSTLDEPKTSPGPVPQDIGLKPDGGLRPCLDGKPHCFSSSTLVGQAQANTKQIGTDWIVKPWTYTGMGVAGAMTDIKKVINTYPPGQNGIDAGGFRVKTLTVPNGPEDAGYIYCQFESAGGYIDDVEFGVFDGTVNVRTSSRLGFLDLGVNAKRYNYFAKNLGGVKGWKTSAIAAKEHLNYFAQNDLDDKDVAPK